MNRRELLDRLTAVLGGLAVLPASSVLRAQDEVPPVLPELPPGPGPGPGQRHTACRLKVVESVVTAGQIMILPWLRG